MQPPNSNNYSPSWLSAQQPMQQQAGGDMPGFKNMEPRSREEREAGKSKDMLEKQRLKARYNGAVKYDPPMNPLQPVAGSAMYQDEYKRFERDTAAEEFQARQQRHQQQQDIYARRCDERYERDKSRWAAVEANEKKQEQRYEQARATGVGAKSNISGEQFNIVTLDYRNGSSGEALRQKDAVFQQKSQARATTLYQHEHCVSHNIITGQVMNAPPPPIRQPSAAYQRAPAPWER